MTELVAIILAVGTLLPLLTSVVQQPRWSDRVRTYMAVGVSVLAGLVTYVSQYGLNLDTPSALVTVVVGIVLAAAASYKTIWQTSGIAPRIEAATSRGSSVRQEISTTDTAIEGESRSGSSFNSDLH